MKKMKKSMFFSSILMIVILVVALSTSTFAWFTSSETANVTETALYSASSSAANITVGWDTTSKLTAISFKSIEGAASGLSPMILKQNPYDDVAFSDIKWHTAPAQIGDDGQEFNSSPTDANPWKPEFDGETTPPGYAAGTFYVNNWNTVNDTDITITVTSLADPQYGGAEATPGTPESFNLASAFRLAIWTKVGTTTTFNGVYAPSGFAYFADTWAKGDPVSDITIEANQIAPVATFTGITVPKAVGSTAGSVAIIARAWFDGTELTDQLASRSVTFTLKIQAVV